MMLSWRVFCAQEKVDLGAVKGSLANTNLHLVAFPAAQQQQPNQPPMPSTTVTSGESCRLLCLLL